jgi:hypothetical protein
MGVNRPGSAEHMYGCECVKENGAGPPDYYNASLLWQAALAHVVTKYLCMAPPTHSTQTRITTIDPPPLPPFPRTQPHLYSHILRAH